MPLKTIIFAGLFLFGSMFQVRAEDSEGLKALRAEEIALRKDAYALRVKYEDAAKSGDQAKADVLKQEWLEFRKRISDEIKAKRDLWVKENPQEAMQMMERRKQWVKEHPQKK